MSRVVIREAIGIQALAQVVQACHDAQWPVISVMKSADGVTKSVKLPDGALGLAADPCFLIIYLDPRAVPEPSDDVSKESDGSLPPADQSDTGSPSPDEETSGTT